MYDDLLRDIQARQSGGMAPEESNPYQMPVMVPAEIAPKGDDSPGFIRSLMHDVAGGAVDYAEMAGRAGRAIPGGTEAGIGQAGISPGIIQWAEKFQAEHPNLQPRERKGVSRWLHEGVRAATTSMIAGAPGLAVGAAAGSTFGPVGTLVGGLVGYAFGGGTLFGLAEYDSTLEETRKAGVPLEQAEPAAIKNAIYEGGFEFAADILEGLTLGAGRVLTVPGKQALKSGIKSLFKIGTKQAVKRGAGLTAIETGSEMLTGGLQTEEYRKLGLTDKRFVDGAKEAFGPAFVASLIFAGMGEGGMQLNRRRIESKLKNADADPKDRIEAATEVYKTLQKVDSNLAEHWGQSAAEAINNKQPISVDQAIGSDTELETEISGEKKKTTPKDILLDEHEEGASAREMVTGEREETLEAEEAAAAFDEETLEAQAEEIPEAQPEVKEETRPIAFEHLSDDDILKRVSNIDKAQKAGRMSKRQGENLALLNQELIDRGIKPIEQEWTPPTEQPPMPKIVKPKEEAAKPEEIDEAANEAATSPENELPEPTEAQKEAGNYKKGHVSLQGMDITIENPRGSERSGTDKSGKKWSTTMQHHYGYFKRSEGKDGDQIDVFIGPDVGIEKAYIVDQVDPETGKFDEHKTLLGFNSEEEARTGYLSNYEKDWKGLGAITELPIDEFKKWIGDGKRKKEPFSKEGIKDEGEKKGRLVRPEREGEEPGRPVPDRETGRPEAGPGGVLQRPETDEGEVKPKEKPVPKPAEPKKVPEIEAGEAVEGEEGPWDTTTTDMPLYDNILKNPEYHKKEKGLEGRTVWMSPDEYLEMQAKEKGVDISDDIKKADQALVSKYSRAMKKGDKFPMLTIETGTGNQEGKHRALAAQDAGISRVPVFIVDKVKAGEKPTPEKPKSEIEIRAKRPENEIRKALEERKDQINDAFESLDEGDQGPLHSLINEIENDAELEAVRRSLDERGINPDRYLPKTPYSPAKNKTLSLEEMEGAIEVAPEKPAKGKEPKPEKIEATPEVKPTEQKEPEPIGKAWINNKQKPIVAAREITKGKFKGKIEVTLTAGRDKEGKVIPGRRVKVDKKSVIEWPGEGETVEIKPKETSEEPIKVTGEKEKTVSVDMPETKAKDLAPKEQKKYLITEIDEVLKTAKTDEDFELEHLEKLRKYDPERPASKVIEMAKRNMEKVGTVTIHVPGDGDFTILNTKKALEAFKKAAKQFPVSEPMPTKGPAVATTKPMGNRIAGIAGEYYNDFKPRKQGIIERAPDEKGKPAKQFYVGGYFTDRNYIIKTGKKPDKLKHPILTGKEAPTIEPVLKDAKKAKSAVLVGETLTSPDWNLDYKPVVHAATKDGTAHFLYNAAYVDSILTVHPKATPHINKEANGLLVFKDKGEIVGAVMPMRTTGKGIGSFDSLPDIAQKGYAKRFGITLEEKKPKPAEKPDAAFLGESHWFINEDDRPIWITRKDAAQSGYRGPFSEQEITELTGTDPFYLKKDGEPVYTPDYPKPEAPAEATIEKKETEKGVALYQPGEYDKEGLEGGKKDALYLPKKRDKAEPKARRAKRKILSKTLKEDGLVGANEIRLLPKITKEREVLAKIVGEFGVNIEFFDSPNKHIKQIDGVVLPGLPDTLFVNKDATRPMLLVVGHELTHTLEFRHPDLYKFLIDSIRDNTVDFEGYLKQLGITYSTFKAEREVTEEFALKEFVGDFVAHQLTEKSFYQKLYEKSPDLAKRLMNLIDKILSYFSGRTDKSISSYIADLNKAQDVVAEVLAEVHRRESGKAFEKDLKTEPGFDKERYMTSKEGPGDITTKQASESPKGGPILTGTESDVDIVDSIKDPRERLKLAEEAIALHQGKYDDLTAAVISSQKTFALRDVYDMDIFIDGEKIPHLKIKVKESESSYPGQDMKWTEPFYGKRTLEHDEYFYHASIYSPDEIIFTPKTTCFYFYPDTGFGHIYRIKRKRGFVIDEFDNQTEARFKLREGEVLEYLGEREYLDVNKYKENPWHSPENLWGVKYIEKKIKTSLPKLSSPPEEGGQKTPPTSIPKYQKTADRWRSQMRNHLFLKLTNGTSENLAKQIQSWADKGDIKQESLDQSGLLGWLKTQSGQITKKQVLDYLDEKAAKGMPMFQVGKKGEYDTSGILSEEVKKNIGIAKGLPKPTFKERFKAGTEELKKQRSHFPELQTIEDKDERGRLNDLLRQHQEVPETAKHKAISLIHSFMKGLSKEDYEVFRMSIILSDMVRDINNGLTEDGKLPFGFKTTDEVITAHEQYTSIARNNPKIAKALEKRNDVINDIKNRLIKAKLLKKEVADEENYFHHQVLIHWQAKYGLATGSKDVRTHWRPWMAKRKGSALDYNTEYAQVEFMAVSQQLAQLETVDTLKRIKKESDIYSSVKAETKNSNLKNFMAKLRKAGKIKTDEFGKEIDPLLPWKQKIAMSNTRLAEMAAKGTLEYDSEWEEIVEALAHSYNDWKANKDDIPDYPRPGVDDPRWFHFLSYLINTKKPGANWAATVFKAIRGRDNFIKETLGDDFLTYRNLIPEGYVEWHPDPKKGWFWANTVTDNLLQKLIAREIDPTDVEFRQVLAKGRDLIWIIPKGLADTMDNFREFGDPSHIGKLADWAQSAWKQYILLNPYSVVRYNINNMSGDLDATLAYAPEIARRYALKAAKELWKWHKHKALPKDIQEEIDRARRLGVVGSGWTVQEVDDVLKIISMDKFVRDVILDEKPNWFNPKTWGQKYWKQVQQVTVWRENILRLAAWRYFKDNAGKNLYGASKPDEVNAIRDPEERAAKLARELLGDYGNISRTGEWIRKRMMPFWAWLEINAPRYVYMMRNTKYENREAGSLKGRVAAVGTKKMILGAGKMAIRASMLYGLVMLWNMTMFPKEEEELAESGRDQLHVILGRREDGSIMTLRFQGALSDALSWFGLEDLPQDIKDVTTGKNTIQEKLKEVPVSFLNRWVQAVRPDIKLFGETITGKSIYPDYRKPIPIRDKVEHVLKTFKLDKIYREVGGRPGRGKTPGAPRSVQAMEHFVSDLKDVLIYEQDPGVLAYYDSRRMAFDWLAKTGDERAMGGTPTKKGNALYWYKQAMKYGDLDAAQRYLQKYYDLGGTRTGKLQSIRMAHPLASIPKMKRYKYKQSLTPSQRRALDRALEWYGETYIKKRPGEPQ